MSPTIGLPPPDPEICLVTPRVSRFKGGTLIDEDVRDLQVNRRRMFHELERVKGWIPIDGYHHAGPGPLVSPEEQEEMYPALKKSLRTLLFWERSPQEKPCGVPGPAFETEFM